MISLKTKKITIPVLLLLALALAYAASTAPSKKNTPAAPPPYRELEVSFFLNINKERDFWVGDLLNFYSKDGAPLGRLSKYAGTQSAAFPNPDTISFDLMNTELDSRLLKRDDLQDLGRPGDNTAYIAFQDGELFASSSKNGYIIYSKKSLESPWVEIGPAEGPAETPFLIKKRFPGILRRFSNQDDYINAVYVSKRRLLINLPKTGF